MGKLKRIPLVIAGTLAGIVALRSVRKRRSETVETEQQAETQDTPETATEHAKAAIEHARLAVEKTREDLPETTE
jgi:GAF domain-containing protein